MTPRDELMESLTVERFSLRPGRCGKQQFPSQAVAENYARLVEMANDDGINRHSYHCERCDSWHITRQNRQEKTA